MAWNGSGSFLRVHDWTQDALAGLNIEASRMDAEDDNFRAGIENCLTKDGQNAPTLDLPMAGKKHTNVGNAVARNNYLAVGQYQDGFAVYAGDSAGTTSALTLTLSPTITAYVTGMAVRFKSTVDALANATLNIDTVGARDIWVNGAKIKAQDLVTNGIYTAVYDGAVFHLFSSIVVRAIDQEVIGCALDAATPADDTEFTKNSVEVAIPFTNEEFDSDSFHDPVTNRTRITIPTDYPGAYQFNFSIQVDYQNSPSEEFLLYLRKNGSGNPLHTPSSVFVGTSHEPRGVAGSCIIELSAGDYVELIGRNPDATYDADLAWVLTRGASLSCSWLGQV